MNLDYFLQLFVQGIIIGCVYATAALGFVLIYKSSRVINLAHGYLIAIGGCLTYVFYGMFRGLFGPLQDLAVVGVLTIVTASGVGAEADQQFLRMTYRVAGGADAGLDKLAPAVNGVIGEQFKRLKSLIETGSAN